jgi:hypothetical protein
MEETEKITNKESTGKICDECDIFNIECSGKVPCDNCNYNKKSCYYIEKKEKQIMKIVIIKQKRQGVAGSNPARNVTNLTENVIEKSRVASVKRGTKSVFILIS